MKAETGEVIAGFWPGMNKHEVLKFVSEKWPKLGGEGAAGVSPCVW